MGRVCCGTPQVGFPEDSILGWNLKGGISWGAGKGFGLRPMARERRTVPRDGTEGLGRRADGSSSPVSGLLTGP